MTAVYSDDTSLEEYIGEEEAALVMQEAWEKGFNIESWYCQISLDRYKVTKKEKLSFSFFVTLSQRASPEDSGLTRPFYVREM